RVALDVRASRCQAGAAPGNDAPDRPRVLGPVLRAGAGKPRQSAARDLLAYDQQLSLPVSVPDRAPDRVPARGGAARRGEREGVRERGGVREGAAGPVDGARDGETGGGGVDAGGYGGGAAGGGRVRTPPDSLLVWSARGRRWESGGTADLCPFRWSGVARAAAERTASDLCPIQSTAGHRRRRPRCPRTHRIGQRSVLGQLPAVGIVRFRTGRG